VWKNNTIDKTTYVRKNSMIDKTTYVRKNHMIDKTTYETSSTVNSSTWFHNMINTCTTDKCITEISR